MSLKFLSFLRKGEKILSKLLPQSIHTRIVGILKAAYKEYARSTAHTDSVANKRVNINIFGQTPGRLFQFSSVAKPLAPFIKCTGGVINSDTGFYSKLAKHKGEEKCDLVLCCSFQGRHQVLEQVVSESLTSNESGNIRWMLVGSTPEDGMFIRELAIKTRRVAGCIVENNPLGRKWLTCVKLAALYYDAELFGITGSDDILSSRLIDHIVSRHRTNKTNIIDPDFMPSMYAAMEWLVCNTNKNTSHAPQIVKCNYDYESAFQPLGAGRFYTRAFMDNFNSDIFESAWEKCLDDKGYFLVKNNKKTIEYYTVEDGPLVSVKGDWVQMNSFDALLEASTVKLREYSFIGHSLLRGSLSSDSYRYLFKPAKISPQFNFSKVSMGIDG